MQPDSPRWPAGPYDDTTDHRLDPLVGTTFDNRYRILGSLGEGGMGLVYEAIQLSVERAVAVKVIRDSHHRDRTKRRFLREAKMLTSLAHPNIVDVYDFGETAAGAPYLVMERLRGNTLADELAVHHRLEPARVASIAIELCDALAAAHAQGIIHRDLKPANVMLLDAPRDHVKVLDFGLAKSLSIESDPVTTLTEAGTLLGTPLYLAPEALGGEPDPRSDLYSLGCILHEMLAGAPPFSDPAINMILARHLTEPPPPLPADVPPVLAELVHALLAKSPEARPASAAGVRARLQAFLDEPPGATHDADELPTLVQLTPAERPTLQAMPPPPPRTALVAAKRSPVPVIVLSLALLSLSTAVAMLVSRSC